MLDLTTVRSRLASLAERDPDFEIAGSDRHRYQLLAPLDESRVASLEAQLGCAVPDDYRRFLIEVAEGGAGPGFGLTPFTESVGAVVNDPIETQRARRPFPLSEPLLGPDELSSRGPGRLDLGVLALAAYGSGIDPHLVINGPEAGNVWVFDVISDGGVYPFSVFDVGFLHDPRRSFPETREASLFEERLSFSDWYADWLAVTEDLAGQPID